MKKLKLMSMLALAGMAQNAELASPMIQSLPHGANPIFSPMKHSVESYRSQQRKAKQRRKARI
jgi:hypothetical protein